MIPEGLNRWDGIYLEWIDSSSWTGWKSEHEIETEDSLCRTLGFFYKETEQSVWIVLNHDVESDDTNGGIAVPKVAITAIHPVKWNLEDLVGSKAKVKK